MFSNSHKRESRKNYVEATGLSKFMQGRQEGQLHGIEQYEANNGGSFSQEGSHGWEIMDIEPTSPSSRPSVVTKSIWDQRRLGAYDLTIEQEQQENNRKRALGNYDIENNNPIPPVSEMDALGRDECGVFYDHVRDAVTPTYEKAVRESKNSETMCMLAPSNSYARRSWMANSKGN